MQYGQASSAQPRGHSPSLHHLEVTCGIDPAPAVPERGGGRTLRGGDLLAHDHRFPAGHVLAPARVPGRRGSACHRARTAPSCRGVVTCRRLRRGRERTQRPCKPHSTTGVAGNDGVQLTSHRVTARRGSKCRCTRVVMWARRLRCNRYYSGHRVHSSRSGQ